MDISLSYELDRDDYIDSQIAYNRASEAVKRNIKRTRVSMASFYLFAGLVAFPALSGIWRFVVTGAILALAVAHILSVRSLNEARVRRLAGKMLDAAGDERLTGRKKLSLDGEELVYGGKSGSTRALASSVVRVLETETNFHIFTSDTASIILPKVVDGDADAPSRLVDFVKARMSEKAASSEGTIEPSAPVS